jgi:hypothetical protein
MQRSVTIVGNQPPMNDANRDMADGKASAAVLSKSR